MTAPSVFRVTMAALIAVNGTTVGAAYASSPGVTGLLGLVAELSAVLVAVAIAFGPVASGKRSAREAVPA